MTKEKELLQRALRIFSDASIQPEPLKKWLHDVIDFIGESEPAPKIDDNLVRYAETDKCIGRFKNGNERYKTSATFNRVVQMLVRGANTYDIIDDLCQCIDDQSKAFEQYIIRDTRPFKMF